MKKIRLVLLLLAALALAGCDTNDSPANKESTIGNLLPPADWEQYVAVDKDEHSEEAEDEIGLENSVGNSAENQENMESYLAHHSEWYPYKDISDVSYGFGADHDFMNSGDQNFKHLWYYALSDILYDYGQRTDQDLLSDGWVVDGITLIGNDYYNIRLHQKESEAGAALLLNSAKREYIHILH